MKWQKLWKEFIIGRYYAKLYQINFKKIITTCKNSIIKIISLDIIMDKLIKKSKKLIKKQNKKWILNKKVFFSILII